MSILQDLYDSEINVSISTFWDGGYQIKLGDLSNGFKDECCVDRWGQVELWLKNKAIEYYPDSLFARIYRDGLVTWRTHRESI